MPIYCVNKKAQENGDHEVHEMGCKYLPDPKNQMDLGYFPNCRDAVAKAKLTYPKADGCYYCSPDCHTS